MHFHFSGLGHALAELATEQTDNPEVQRVLDAALDKLVDKAADEVPAPLHGVVESYGRRLAHRAAAAARTRIEAAARPEQADGYHGVTNPRGARSGGGKD